MEWKNNFYCNAFSVESYMPWRRKNFSQKSQFVSNFQLYCKMLIFWHSFFCLGYIAWVSAVYDLEFLGLSREYFFIHCTLNTIMFIDECIFKEATRALDILYFFWSKWFQQLNTKSYYSVFLFFLSHPINFCKKFSRTQ